MPERQYLITENQLQAILAQAKKTDIYAEETILEDQTVLDVFISHVPKISLQQGVPISVQE